MSFYLQKVPGSFFFVGAGVPDIKNEPHHNPCFNLDERALSIGMEMMANIALDFLK
jgi:amidohydrolase